MRCRVLAPALLLPALVALAAAQTPPPPPPPTPPPTTTTPPPPPSPTPVRLRGAFGGVSPDQFYQSGVTVSAGQLAAEVGALRAEIDRSAADPATRTTLIRLADQAAAAADAFRRAAAATADRARLYRAHEPVDQAVRNLATAAARLGASTAGFADALARVRYADQQVHTAMTGGDTSPGVTRSRAARLAAGLEAQTARLRDLVAATPALAADPRLGPELRAVADRAARVRQTLDAGGTPDQAAPDFRQAAAGWSGVADPLTRGFAGRPAVRQQAARVDGLFRALNDVIPAAAGPPAYTPVPQAGFVAAGALAVSAGDSGGPRVRVFHDLAAGLAGNPPGGAGQSTDFFAYDPDFRGGVRVAVADVNGDGTPDYIGVTAPGTPNRLEVLDGKTLAVTASFAPFEAAFTGGLYAAAADLNGDGKADVAVSPDQGGGPVVAVYDGARLSAGQTGDAALINRFFGIADPNFRGGDRPALGDLNRDGTPDLVVAAGFGGGPRVAVFDGRSVAGGAGDPTRLVPDFYAFEPTLRNGAYVAAGPLTAGGAADLAFGGGPGGGPRVRVVDGAKLLSAGAFNNLDDVASAVQVASFFSGDPASRDGVRVALRDTTGTGAASLAAEGGAGGLVSVYAPSTLLTAGAPTPDQTVDPLNGVFVG